MSFFFNYMCTFILCLSCIEKCYLHSTNSMLLVISLDGFRWDYLEIMKKHGRDTPNFDMLVQGGVKAEYVKPVFPPKTFPSHFSISTGLHVENHGVVADNFYDPTFNESFSKTNASQAGQGKWFDNDGLVEPIWITNQRGPQTLFPKRSGVLFWPGSTASYNSMLPYKWKYWTESATCDSSCRINQMIDWFATEKDPINLGMVHIDELEKIGLEYGIESSELFTAISQIDDTMGVLMKKLQENHLFHKLNLIITSDHGMAEVNNSIEVNIEKPLYKCFGDSPIWSIMPNPDKEDELSSALQKLGDEKGPHLKVYKRSEIPSHYYYSKHRRILDYNLFVDEHYQLIRNGADQTKTAANCGYDNSLPSQRAFFLGHGPVFKENEKIGPISQLDIYPLLCHILDINPLPHNGSLEQIELVLKEEHENFYVTIITFLVTVGFAATVSGVCCVAACRVYRRSRVITRRRHIVGVRLGNIQDESRSALLESDDEEIP